MKGYSEGVEFNMVINVGGLAPRKTGDVSREHTFVMILLYICHSVILPREMLDTAVSLTCSAAAPAVSYLLL